MAIYGIGGAGKTFMAITFAITFLKLKHPNLSHEEICQKIYVGNTESTRIDYFESFGPFKIVDLDEKGEKETFEKWVARINSAGIKYETFIEFISFCESEPDCEFCIIDSASHEWENILNRHQSQGGNSFANWAIWGPRHNEFLSKIMRSSLPVIATLKAKEAHVIDQGDTGKQVIKKIGTKAEMRDNYRYHFSFVVNLDLDHTIHVEKDVPLSMDEPNLFNDSEVLTPVSMAEKIYHWCNSGMSEFQQMAMKISQIQSAGALGDLWKSLPGPKQTEYKDLFNKQKLEIKRIEESVQKELNQENK